MPAASMMAPSTSSLGWPTYGSSYANTRFVDLPQIDARTVQSLRVAWRYETHIRERFESSPIVVGKTMYVTTAVTNSVIALDALTGSMRWRFDPDIGYTAPCCGLVNRGVAVESGRVFVATLDGRLIALNARNGRKMWETTVGSAVEGFSETMAPLAWRGEVFIGSSGGDFGIRGSFSAYRQSDGKLLWRWWSVSPGWEGKFVTSVHGVALHRNIAKEKADLPKHRDAWKHGGGPVWMTPALDPARSAIYLSTGNPAPNYNADARPGDNLYTDSIVALDAATGRMKWYYQQTPHDVWDYDAASPPLLFDTLDVRGRRVAAVGEAGKTGWFYVLNRDTGGLIRISQNFVPQRGIYSNPMTYGSIVEPGGLGGTVGPASYNPHLHLVYIAAIDRPEIHRPEGVEPWKPRGGKWQAGSSPPVGWWQAYVSAVNVDTGRLIWRSKMSGGKLASPASHMFGGTLALGNLVFAGDPSGSFYAFDARTGATHWTYHFGIEAGSAASAETNTLAQRVHDLLASIKRWVLRIPPPQPRAASVDAPPMAYAFGGREYLAITANILPSQFAGGNVVFCFALPRTSDRSDAH